MGLRWYVVRTEPRAEFLAADELGRAGYEIFFPWFKASRPKLGRANVPLFPGYLFIRCDRESGVWPAFRSSQRIAGWVNFGGEIPSIPDEVVAELTDRWESINAEGGLIRRFTPGEKVRIVSGNFQGLAEIVEDSRSPQARAKVLLQFMGRLVQAQVPCDLLESVEIPPVQEQRIPRRTRGKGRWVQGFGPRALANS